MKLYISPHPDQYAEDGRGGGGIQRVVAAQAKHLPKYGIKVVNMAKDADVVNVHAGALVETDRPIVANNHGMYWTGDFAWYDDYWQYNGEVIEALRRAHAIIVPSEWVAYPIKRDMRVVPYVIPHGVDLEAFEFSRQHEGFVLWGKPRADIVSDPTPVNELAARVPSLSFVTTFGRPTTNVKVTGPMPYEQFRSLSRRAAVWLATTRETGDIGSREAMAMGIPVLGFNHGATADLVIHGETGYLAEPGDYDDLLNGLRFCLNNRDRLADAGRELVKNYQWRDIMGHYAAVYEEVLRGDEYPVKVSVVVPTYNYAHFLPDCLESLTDQGMQDFEVVVVNDGSTDNTLEVLTNLGAELGFGIKIINQSNQGLCAALNTGHAHARGRYIVNLDADNALAPDTLRILSEALDSKPWLDVASGGLGMIQPEGQYTRTTDWPFGSINVHQQLGHVNQLTSSSMMRARSVKRLGGYRPRVNRNEDGEFWCRAMSAGLRFEQVTSEPTLLYRWHDNNKSRREGGEHDPNGPLSWNYFFPHRNNVNITPFAMTGNPPKGSWAVRSYATPCIAICIPLGPGHEQYLADALDSVAGQTYQNIECIVANDTGNPLDVASMGHPWVKVVEGPREGPGPARNAAIAAAKAPLILPLDADDMLDPDAVKSMYIAWLEAPENLVYTDCYTEDRPEHRKYYRSEAWSWERIKSQAIYQVSILYAKQWWEAVGGYEPDAHWEDWLFGLKLHMAGVGATYLEKPWGVYRHWTGFGQAGRDNEGFGTEVFEARLQKVYDWIATKEEEIEMACPGCGRRARGRRASNPKPPPASNRYAGDGSGETIIVYTGERGGGFSLNSRSQRGRKYWVQREEPFKVPDADAKWLLRIGGFETPKEELPVPVVEIPAAPPSVLTIETVQPPPIVPKPQMPVASPPVPALAPSPPKEMTVGRPERLLAFPVNAPLEDVTSLTDFMVVMLKNLGITKVSELAFDIEHNVGAKILSVKGIGPARLEQITEELFE